MIDQNLVSYINESLNQGSTRSDIENVLLEKGWKKEMIDEGFNTIDQKSATSSPTIAFNDRKSTSRKLLIIVGGIVIVLALILGSYKLSTRQSSIASDQSITGKIKTLVDNSNQKTKLDRFSGKLEKAEDCSATEVDGGCYIVVDGKNIDTGGGWRESKPVGSIIGNPQVGDEVEVYAEHVGGKYYSIYGSSDYYVKRKDSNSNIDTIPKIKRTGEPCPKYLDCMPIAPEGSLCGSNFPEECRDYTQISY